MFDLHKFVFETILSMIGKEPEHKVRQYALGWFDKGVLTEEDLTAIEAQLEAARPEPEEIDEEDVEE